MNDMKGKVKKAYEMAKTAHQGQVRKSSHEEYIHHPVRVYDLVLQYTDDADVLCAALLHDAVEDTNLTFDAIESELGKRVRHLVEEVSTKKGDKKALSWKRRKENTVLSIYSLSEEALLIELADKVDNAYHFKNLINEAGQIRFDAFHEKDPNMQEWYYWSLYEAFLSCTSSSNAELVEAFAKYISHGFGRSYASYKGTANKGEEKHFDFFQFRTLLAKNKGQGPVVFEVLGCLEENREAFAGDLALNLKKYHIQAEFASSYLYHTKDSCSEEIVACVQKLKDNSTADVLFVITGGLWDKRAQFLERFQQEKNKNPDIVYTVVEELDLLKERASYLIDGVIGTFTYDRLDLDSIDQYMGPYKELACSMRDLPDDVSRMIVPLENAECTIIPYVLETTKSVLEKRQASDLSDCIVYLKNKK